MRRILLVLMALSFLAGCETQPRPVYVVPSYRPTQDPDGAVSLYDESLRQMEEERRDAQIRKMQQRLDDLEDDLAGPRHRY